jgi:hypothetical protein
MARILIVGGLYTDEPDEQLRDARQQFAADLGKEIINRGHILLGGCRTTLDAEVASAAASAALAILGLSGYPGEKAARPNQLFCGKIRPGGEYRRLALIVQ